MISNFEPPECIWSIGIYTGNSPLHLSPPASGLTPVLTAADVTDVPSAFVADPFLVRDDGEWFMFFEMLSSETGRGEIGMAKSRNGLAWYYQQSILREPFHLSYPHVFRWQGDYFMTPEALGHGAIVLYRAHDFPFEWKPEARLIEGGLADPTPFEFDGMWWLFACPTPYEHDTLRLYYATCPTGEWREHPSSPVLEGNARIARPGGRVLSFDGRLIRYTQDCTPYYGHRLRAVEITKLNTCEYEEHECSESPILSAGNGWNGAGMHHADAQEISSGTWIACVDGHRFHSAPTLAAAPSALLRFFNLLRPRA